MRLQRGTFCAAVVRVALVVTVLTATAADIQPISVRVRQTAGGPRLFVEGRRGVELRGYVPFYVKADSAPTPCMALNGRARTLANVCPRWSKWEKL